MRRRSLIVGAVAAGTLAACGTNRRNDGRPAPSAAAAGSMLDSTSASRLAPRDATPVTPPAGRSPGRAYAVGRRDLPLSRGADRPLPTRVWYPSTGTPPSAPKPVADARPEPGRYPVVLFSHGLTAQPDDYAAMLARWAQAGFVVAAPKFPNTSYGVARSDPQDIANQPADVSAVLDQLLAMTGDPLTAVLNRDRIAAAGHSAGAITTVGLFSARRDERLSAGIVHAGTDFLSTPFTGRPAPMMFVHGRKDETVAWTAGRTVYQAVPWSRAMLSITDGGHTTTGADYEATTGSTTEFLLWSLYGDTAARSRLPAKAAAGTVATLEQQL